MGITSVVLTPSTSALPPGWSAGDFRDAIQRAANRWSFPNVPCAVTVTVSEGRPAWLAARDGVDVVAYRNRTWCHNERCGAGSTFPLRATAETTTYPEAAPGRAPTEADVELNGVAYRFTGRSGGDVAADARAWTVPMTSVLAHEIGHVLGLADACGAARRASGQPITDGCSATDRARVMFAASVADTPTAADVAELCALYPPEAASGLRAVASAGCASAPIFARLVSAPTLLTLLLSLMLVRVRLRRKFVLPPQRSARFSDNGGQQEPTT